MPRPPVYRAAAWLPSATWQEQYAGPAQQDRVARFGTTGGVGGVSVEDGDELGHLLVALMRRKDRSALSMPTAVLNFHEDRDNLVKSIGPFTCVPQLR